VKKTPKRRNKNGIPGGATKRKKAILELQKKSAPDNSENRVDKRTQNRGKKKKRQACENIGVKATLSSQSGAGNCTAQKKKQEKSRVERDPKEHLHLLVQGGAAKGSLSCHGFPAAKEGTQKNPHQFR